MRSDFAVGHGATFTGPTARPQLFLQAVKSLIVGLRQTKGEIGIFFFGI